MYLPKTTRAAEYVMIDVNIKNFSTFILNFLVYFLCKFAAIKRTIVSIVKGIAQISNLEYPNLVK